MARGTVSGHTLAGHSTVSGHILEHPWESQTSQLVVVVECQGGPLVPLPRHHLPSHAGQSSAHSLENVF